MPSPADPMLLLSHPATNVTHPATGLGAHRATAILLAALLGGLSGGTALGQTDRVLESSAVSAAHSDPAGSLRDRVITASGFEDFRNAVAVDPVSPALSRANVSDLVISRRDMPGPDVTAVVLKPKPIGRTYQIPSMDGVSDVYGALKDSFEEAAKAKAGTIRFPKSQMIKIKPRTAGGRHLKIGSLQDVVIDLNGSTLQFTEISPGIVFRDCQRVTLRNGALQGTGLLATIGKVIADDSPAGVRLELLPEYARALEESTVRPPQLITVGPAERSPAGHWRMRTNRYFDLFINRRDVTNNFRYAKELSAFISTSPLSEPELLADGEKVWMLHQNNTGTAILLDSEEGAGNEDLTFQDIDCSNIPGMVVAGAVNRGLHFKNFNIRKDATDPLAFFAASSDGIHIDANGGDIVIEGCYIGANGDDKITIKGNYWRVAAIDRGSHEITVVPADRSTNVRRWGRKGDRVVFIDSNFTVIGESLLRDQSLKQSSKQHVVRLNKIPAALQTGSLIGNVDAAGPRVVIVNNIFEDTRAQAILVQSSHVVVDNNDFQGIAGPAIKLNMGLHLWFEAIAVQNVMVSNNRFRSSSRSLQKPNELIHLQQRDGSENPLDIIHNVKIIGNRAL